jgi:hypothetical protein
VQLEGLGELKNAMTSTGIEPMAFLLVAQRLQEKFGIQNSDE